MRGNPGVTYSFSANEVEQLFALGSGFDELRTNLKDLESRVRHRKIAWTGGDPHR